MVYQTQKQQPRYVNKPKTLKTEPDQPTNITVVKPSSAKRRKVFVKTIANQQINLASQFLT
jgi:hypothetical protein